MQFSLGWMLKYYDKKGYVKHYIYLPIISDISQKYMHTNTEKKKKDI